jgi:hypothetical protein
MPSTVGVNALARMLSQLPSNANKPHVYGNERVISIEHLGEMRDSPRDWSGLWKTAPIFGAAAAALDLTLALPRTLMTFLPLRTVDHRSSSCLLASVVPDTSGG